MQILRSAWIISAEIRYLLLEQKKFQNKSKNIDKVYRLVSFRCIMLLSYRVTFLCNVFSKFIIHQKALYDIFYEKVAKWCSSIYIFFNVFWSGIMVLIKNLLCLLERVVKSYEDII